MTKKQYFFWKLKRSSYITFALVFINVCVWAYGNWFNAGIFSLYDLDLVSVLRDHEYYRAITSVFLHMRISHIFNNMLTLLLLGNLLETEVGHIPFGIIYLLSGIAGSVASLYYKMINAVPAGSLGASGAIFGLDGLLLAMVILAGDRLRHISINRVAIMIILSVYSGYVGANIDNAAHVGGLMGGFVCGAIYCMFFLK